ncbi:archease, partial [Candidatus Babeliales bacterium]|nr:archease [Candidatus Babeliales bacterium]
MKKDFQVLSDTADFKLRVFGATLHDVFRNALVGMFQGMRPQSDLCVYTGNRLSCKDYMGRHEFDVDGSEVSSLLVNFLSHALSLSAQYNEVYCDVTISS